MPILNSFSEIPERGWHCPPAERLAAYVDGQLSGRQRQSLERHLADCAYCRKSVAGALADSAHPVPETPAWLRQKAKAQLGERKARNWRWAWALAPALAVALAAAVLIESPTERGKLFSPSTTQSASPSRTSPATAPSSSVPAATASPNLTRGVNSRPEELKLLAPVAGAVLEPGHLHFAWSPVPTASSYRIRISTIDGGLVWEQRSQQPHAQPPATLKLAPGNYFAWVTAYLNDGREQQSAPVSFQVQAQR